MKKALEMVVNGILPYVCSSDSMSGAALKAGVLKFKKQPPT